MRFAFATLFVIAIARAAAAAPAAEPASTPWQLGLVGGALQPLGSMKFSHERGLDAGMRVSWTSRLGLGVEAAVDYSPLPHVPTADGTRFDTTYATAAIGPRFAAGWSRLAFAIAAGGGVAIDHTITTDVAPAIEAGLEIQVTVVDGGGILFTGGGTRAFGSLGYEYAWGMGGLALSF
ncbi:MAG TPA: hypothetical protein VL463_01780 [Kofleriaceae bacterium]|jgi:hypothetical protein|nr:hypothetical protein [Kofleriaceae bacterium]